MAPELKWSVCAVEGRKHLENFCYVTFTQKVENLRQPECTCNFKDEDQLVGLVKICPLTSPHENNPEL